MYPITIYTESSPNPNSLKFVLNKIIVPEGVTFDFPNLESAGESPLAESVFQNFDFAERVFMMNNFITVTKSEQADWQEVAVGVKDFIRNYLQDNKPLFSRTLLKSYETEFNQNAMQDSEIVKKIKGILDEYVKPAVESDGGAINFHSFSDEGVVKVLLQGSCSGCPSSTLTLKAGIENILKRMIPEVTEVVAEGV